MKVSEKKFEEAIEAYVVKSKYVQRDSKKHYDKHLCLDPQLVVDFIVATQAKEWKKLQNLHGQDTKRKFLTRVSGEITKRGTLDVLRNGVKDYGCKFKLAYFVPSSGLNEELQKLYKANILSVVRQLYYSKNSEKSLDLGLFLNGIPIFTAELKNPLNGQNVENAVWQYKRDRSPKEPLFHMGRCLAHFAVDPELVYMTTDLQGTNTIFLPFNRGRDGGAGNPHSLTTYATAYLWEQIWAKDSILNLIQHFISLIEEQDEKGRKTGKKKLIFPRYHQLDAVRRLVDHAKQHGQGHQYLIQHSAGSGKSNSIAWLAHQLSVLHDADNKRVFDSIIVITDRRILDRQLQRTVRQFQQTLGVVENIDKTSKDLKKALELGKTIIVTTLQKFPVIADEIQDLPGKRFAVIIDEAHSSQSGESTKSLKQVLSVDSLEEAEKEEGGEFEDLEDRIVAEMKKRGRQPNVSTFAFTATPKTKTLELFGTPEKDGSFHPFSLYSMRQAIEENFILDVLENYTTYKAYWKLLKKIEDDPQYDEKKAKYLLKEFVDLHDHTVAQKVTIMVEHFADKVASQISGKAKAMIVTRSRLHAVRYKIHVDKYLKEKGYPFKALVAFSGEVKDGGKTYSESNMNGFPETHTANTFEEADYGFLIVAEKFQTGFDQPLLHTMYVDKKLSGVHAVQTLSRLNRVHPPDKQGTMVLDFANEADDILKAFQPYYDRTTLKEPTDPNLLYDLQTSLAAFGVYSEDEVRRFAEYYFDKKANTQDKLYGVLDPVVERFSEAEDGAQVDFRGKLTDYVRLYAFLSQIVPFQDPDLEMLYVFARLLRRRLPSSPDSLPREVQQNIDMGSYRIQKTSDGKIPLGGGETELKPMEVIKSHPVTDAREALSAIIQDLNDRFGTDFTEGDKVVIEHLEEQLAKDEAINASMRANPPEKVRLTFDQKAKDLLQDFIDSHFRFYKKVTDDERLGKYFLDTLFTRYIGRSARVPLR
ncbi:MAG: DEAD/DEAH box helicase family protein [Pseudomonadota bacterium]